MLEKWAVNLLNSSSRPFSPTRTVSLSISHGSCRPAGGEFYRFPPKFLDTLSKRREQDSTTPAGRTCVQKRPLLQVDVALERRAELRRSRRGNTYVIAVAASKTSLVRAFSLLMLRTVDASSIHGLGLIRTEEETAAYSNSIGLPASCK